MLKNRGEGTKMLAVTTSNKKHNIPYNLINITMRQNPPPTNLSVS
jgi:hypothetical protein